MCATCVGLTRHCEVRQSQSCTVDLKHLADQAEPVFLDRHQEASSTHCSRVNGVQAHEAGTVVSQYSTVRLRRLWLPGLFGLVSAGPGSCGAEVPGVPEDSFP